MAQNYATSFNPVNYSGMLFNRGNTRTPLSSIIGGRQKLTDHVEFAVGQEYTTDGGVQPEISEQESLTAPDFTPYEREQMTNVTQIFQESVGISYGKQSNMGTLSGLNVASQTAEPIDELAFQTKAVMTKISRDIEFTFINGEYAKATNDTEANQTRGLVPAITTTVEDLDGAPLGYWDVVAMMEAIDKQNAPVNDLVVWCDTTTLLQLNGDAITNKLTVIDSGRNINGINITNIVSPFGTIGLYAGQFLPAGTALLLNLGVLSPVGMEVPGKGNFFLEELAKVGAGTRYQIFGQLGLDHGPEWFHGKFTGISTVFTPPGATTDTETP